MCTSVGTVSDKNKMKGYGNFIWKNKNENYYGNLEQI
jgi:hypothetical protein